MAEEGGGWVKLYRSILKWEWWEDFNCFRLFLYCLLMANSADRRWKGIKVKRGTFVTSLSRLSKETRLSVHQVRDALKRLKSTRELTSKSANRYTIITICNYERYQEVQLGKGQTEGQADGQGNGKQAAGKGQANGNKQEYKNGRNKEGNESSPPNVGEDLSDGASDAAPEIEELDGFSIDYSKLAHYWNEKTKGQFGRILCIQNNRRTLVRARIRQYGKHVFMQAIDKVCASEYLAAQKWFNFDWLVRPNNFDKVMAGNYDNKQTVTKDGKASTNDSRLGLGTVTKPTNKGMQTDI